MNRNWMVAALGLTWRMRKAAEAADMEEDMAVVTEPAAVGVTIMYDV